VAFKDNLSIDPLLYIYIFQLISSGFWYKKLLRDSNGGKQPGLVLEVCKWHSVYQDKR